jgi:hypothetical protein
MKKMEIFWGTDIKGEKIDDSIVIEFNENEDEIEIFNKETDRILEYEPHIIWFDYKIIED